MNNPRDVIASDLFWFLSQLVILLYSFVYIHIRHPILLITLALQLRQVFVAICPGLLAKRH